MSLTITVTKKILENIIHQTFSNFGFLTSSSLLDSLKLLGFYYATNAGISINIEDLRTPNIKKDYIEAANKTTEEISESWSEGLVSEQERFQAIIDSWNIATESLKNRIIDYYQTFDPANNLYIMAFSGARGNMSQVRQLVGMRGLMSDQEGKIIDLPIQTNFREGLSSIDYIISSYGARKGIVDTALKTADSGYLTRRLIYLSQDLIIREIDCKTKNGILIVLKKETSTKNLIGREILAFKDGIFPYHLIHEFENLKNIKIENKKIVQEKNLDAIKNKIFEILNDTQKKTVLTSSILDQLKKISPIILKIRSSLTCQSKGSICQKCYGWDLSQEKLIGLGENIGIIAAQSIGEPGTQLTMRTFHTGGIFTRESLKQTLSPFSGKIIIPNSLKAFLYRTNHGIQVLKLQEETKLTLINWKGIETTILIESGSYLYILKTCFIYKGQLISENLDQSFILTQRKLKPIYSQISGKIIFNDTIPIFRKNNNGNIKRIILKQGLFWILSGKIFSLPIEAKYLFSKNLNCLKPIAELKIVTPKEGVVNFENSSLLIKILRPTETISINLSDLDVTCQNCSVKIFPIVKNYHYVDKYTILAFVYIFPSKQKQIFNKNRNNFNLEIISIEKKKSKYINTFLISTKEEFWKFYGSLGNIEKNKSNEIVKANKKINYFESFEKDLELKYLRSLSYLNLIFNMKKNKEDSYLPKKFQSFSYKNIHNQKKTTIKSFLTILTSKSIKNSSLKIKYSGVYQKRDRNFNLFQNLQAIYLPTNSLLNYVELDYVLEKKNFATLVNYSQQTDDIVQGLPKIEELIEARQSKMPCSLSSHPGIFIFNYISSKRTSNGVGKIFSDSFSIQELLRKKENQSSIQLFPMFLKNDIEDNLEEKRTSKQVVILFHNLSTSRKNIFFYKNKLFKISYCFSESLSEIQKKKLRKIDIIEPELLKSLSNFFKKKIHFNKMSKENLFYKYMSEEIYLYKLNKKLLLRLELIQPFVQYRLPLNSNLLFKHGEFIDIGEPLNDGIIDSHQLLNILFLYHSEREGIINGTLKSLNKFQLILINSIQSIYQGQNVNISSKHIEIIVKQMTLKVIIKNGGETPFLPGELIPLSLIINICQTFKMNSAYKTPTFEPKLLSATTSSLNKDGFLSAAGFQETRRVLTKAAIEGNSDWLRGLKESIISGRIMPAGSAFLNYKQYLDNFYYLKRK